MALYHQCGYDCLRWGLWVFLGPRHTQPTESLGKMVQRGLWPHRHGKTSPPRKVQGKANHMGSNQVIIDFWISKKIYQKLTAFRRDSRLWLTYFIPVWWVASGLSVGGTGFFGVFLKSLKDGSGNPIWTVKQVNSLPIGGSAIQVVTRKNT